MGKPSFLRQIRSWAFVVSVLFLLGCEPPGEERSPINTDDDDEVSVEPDEQDVEQEDPDTQPDELASDLGDELDSAAGVDLDVEHHDPDAQPDELASDQSDELDSAAGVDLDVEHHDPDAQPDELASDLGNEIDDDLAFDLDSEGDVGTDNGFPLPLDIEVFNIVGFDFVLPSDEISSTEPFTGLDLRAAPGDIEPVSFVVRANSDVELTAEVSSMVNIGGTPIPAEQIGLDLRIVRVWEQAGLGRKVDRPEGVEVPELLVYDDAQELHYGWDFFPENLVPGHDDQGVLLNNDVYTSFPTSELDLNQGTVSFWFQPNWDADSEAADHFLFNLRNTAKDEINLFFQQAFDRLVLVLEGDELYQSAVAPIDWISGEWHRVVFTWNTTGGPGNGVASLYLDGSLATELEAGNPLTVLPSVFSLGSYHGSTVPAEGVFDELEVYRYAATPEQVTSGTLEAAHLIIDEQFESLDSLLSATVEARSKRMQPPVLAEELNISMIPAGTLRQFWLTVTVAPEAAPGYYTGTITLEAPGSFPYVFPVNLRVLPFLLEDPAAFHMFYNYFTLDPSRPMFVDEGLFVAYLEDLRDHGFVGLTLYSASSGIEREVELAQEAGLSRIVLIDGFDPANVGLLTDEGLEPYMYGTDEANSNAKLIQHIRLSHEIHEAGGLVATAILFQNSERLRTPSDGVYDLVDEDTGQSFRYLGWTDEALDFSNYHAALLTLTDHEEVVSESTRAVDQPLVDYLAALRGGTESRRDAVETYYWQPWVQSPNMNRFMAGFYLDQSGLDGCWPWGYVWYNFEVRDAFNELELPLGAYREYMTAYPSSTGPIPTTQWEALREGVDDLRYLATLRYYLENDDDDALVEAIGLQLETLLGGYQDPWYLNVKTPQEMADNREQIIDWILALVED